MKKTYIVMALLVLMAGCKTDEDKFSDALVVLGQNTHGKTTFVLSRGIFGTHIRVTFDDVRGNRELEEKK